jgi:predicted DCC family thiol-disulfide oxidoreductase YuxK
MTEGRVAKRAVLLYDGECGFCTAMAELAEERFTADADYVALQSVSLATYGVSEAEARHSLHWVSGDGRIAQGSEAVARLLISSGGAWSVLGRLLLVPPLSFAAAAGYWLVARYRSRIPLPPRMTR